LKWFKVWKPGGFKLWVGRNGFDLYSPPTVAGKMRSYGLLMVVACPLAQFRPFAVMVTCVPPMYGPVALSTYHCSTMLSGFSPLPSAEFRQSRQPGLELSKMNFRNVPEPLVYTSGKPLNCKPPWRVG
jgi:hypothetical protein